jgi:hypothetical protein
MNVSFLNVFHYLPFSARLALCASAAVRWGNPVLTMTLLGGGADPNSVEYGHSALDHAVLGGNVDCVSLLVSHGAKLGVRSSCYFCCSCYYCRCCC